jgi:hypothetical protein
VFKITALLVCEGQGCKRTFRVATVFHELQRRTMESIREEAWAKGWARFRLKNNESNRDLCPACVKKHQERKGP